MDTAGFKTLPPVKCADILAKDANIFDTIKCNTSLVYAHCIVTVPA